jgi:hypothetical protein
MERRKQLEIVAQATGVTLFEDRRDRVHRIRLRVRADGYEAAILRRDDSGEWVAVSTRALTEYPTRDGLIDWLDETLGRVRQDA